MTCSSVKAGDNIEVECQATDIAMTNDNSMRSVINIPFRIRRTGKDFTSVKGKEIPFVVTYCPFCGRSTARYVVGEDATIAAAFAGSVA